MEMITGSCLYCGQQQTIRVSGQVDEEQVDRLVTERCMCDGALKARTQEENMSRVQ